MNIPLISIILPTYNWNHTWLSESIDSVINQSYSNFELIIINDASDNDIEKTILEFINKDNRIKYYKNEENIQLTRTLNKGIELSKWKYIARIDDDDIWIDEKKLEKQVIFMEKNTDYWLCWTWIIIIDEFWNEINRVLYRSFDKNIKNNITWLNQFAHSSVIIRKSILEKVWRYTNKKYCKYTEDYDLWLKIWIHSKLYNLEEYSIKYRVRKWSITWKKKFNQKINTFLIWLKYIYFYPSKIKCLSIQILILIFPEFVINFLVKVNNFINNLK